VSGVCHEFNVRLPSSSVQRTLIMIKSILEVKTEEEALAVVLRRIFIKLVLVSTAVLGESLYTPLFQESLKTKLVPLVVVVPGTSFHPAEPLSPE